MCYRVRRKDGACCRDGVKRPPAAMRMFPHLATAVTFSAGCHFCGGKACFSEGCAPAWGERWRLVLLFWVFPMDISEVREESVSQAVYHPQLPRPQKAKFPNNHILCLQFLPGFKKQTLFSLLLSWLWQACFCSQVLLPAAAFHSFCVWPCTLETVSFLRNKEGCHAHAPCFATRWRCWGFPLKVFIHVRV